MAHCLGNIAQNNLEISIPVTISNNLFHYLYFYYLKEFGYFHQVLQKTYVRNLFLTKRNPQKLDFAKETFQTDFIYNLEFVQTDYLESTILDLKKDRFQTDNLEFIQTDNLESRI